MNRRQHRMVLSGLLCLATIIGGAAGMGCGEATIKTFRPCPTPTGVDFTFRGGVLPVLQTRDCYNGSSCHNKGNGGASGLILGGDNTTPDEIYGYLMTGGFQGQGPDFDVSVGSTAANSLILQKPLSTSPVSHSGGKQFGTENDDGYKAIFLWASNGALNNGTTGCAQ
jgi:hypothetical protein